ncbi:hypothetical protein [Methanolobus sp. ZRKC5]|uniref:hypothetical protein n=1 Tax=unclassified Methanolobus TaxID=2629569 RepID=UPI00313E1B82
MSKTAILLLSLILFLSIVLSSGCVDKTKTTINDVNLRNIPEIFDENVIIILGENANSVESEESLSIADKLENLTGNRPIIKKVAEASEIEKSRNNLIFVGNTRTNPTMKYVYDLHPDLLTRSIKTYWEGTNKGSLLIYSNPWTSTLSPSEKHVLLIYGYDENGTRSVVETFVEGDFFENFSGRGIITSWNNGKISWDRGEVVEKNLAASKALQYWELKTQTYPEAGIFPLNITEKKDYWLVEIGSSGFNDVVFSEGIVSVSKENGDVGVVKNDL